MHESGIVAALVARAELVVHDSGVASAERIGVRIGALSGVDPEVVRTHWQRFATGLTRNAEIVAELDDDIAGEGALGVSLAFVDVGV